MTVFRQCGDRNHWSGCSLPSICSWGPVNTLQMLVLASFPSHHKNKTTPRWVGTASAGLYSLVLTLTIYSSLFPFLRLEFIHIQLPQLLNSIQEKEKTRAWWFIHNELLYRERTSVGLNGYLWETVSLALILESVVSWVLWMLTIYIEEDKERLTATVAVNRYPDPFSSHVKLRGIKFIPTEEQACIRTPVSWGQYCLCFRMNN